MRIGTSFLTAILVILAGVGLGTMFSEPKSETGKEATKKDMEEAWAELLQPREEHEWLAEQAGEWNVEARMWKDGQEEPVSLHGTATITRVLDRFTFEELSIGEGEKQIKFRAHMGYDNSNEEFSVSYIASNCIAIRLLAGQRKDGTLELSGSWMEKGLDDIRVSQRVVYAVKDKDHHMATIFTRYGDGPEMKQLELTYSRKQ